MLPYYCLSLSAPEIEKTYDGLVDYMANDGAANADGGGAAAAANVDGAGAGAGPRVDGGAGDFPPPANKPITAMMRLPFLVVAALWMLLLVKIGVSTAFLAVYNQRGIISFGRNGVNNPDDAEHDMMIANGLDGTSRLSESEQETIERTKRVNPNPKFVI